MIQKTSVTSTTLLAARSNAGLSSCLYLQLARRLPRTEFKPGTVKCTFVLCNTSATLEQTYCRCSRESWSDPCAL